MTKKLNYEDKWCPFTRNTVGGVNRQEDDDNPLWARCIGPHCMMFRADERGYQYKADYRDPEEHVEFCGLVTLRP